jgi:hypothetical protein
MVHKETEHNIWGTLSNRELELLACRIRRRSRRTCGEVKTSPGFSRARWCHSQPGSLKWRLLVSVREGLIRDRCDFVNKQVYFRGYAIGG